MLMDQFGREIYYLRVSITDKCNLRCRYCMPEEGIVLRSHDEMLRTEEMERIIRLFVQEGIRSVRITGGEPLVYKGIIPFVQALNRMNLKDLSMTTNGILLPKYAQELKAAGLNRINISLDTLDPERFRWITRGGNVEEVFAGIEAALQAGLDPVKVNVVVSKGINQAEVWEIAQLAKERPLHLRFIELMPIGDDSLWNRENYVSSEETKRLIENAGGQLLPKKVPGCGPAEVYTLPHWQGTVGFIHAISSHFCDTCNRLRLTSDGSIYPCLHSDISINLLEPIRSGINDEELLNLLREAVALKPKRSKLGSQNHCMHSIGG